MFTLASERGPCARVVQFVTVIVVEPEIVPEVAVMVAVPEATPVASPVVEPTPATALLLVLHDTGEVMLEVLVVQLVVLVQVR